jgi:hypothetical protein
LNLPTDILFYIVAGAAVILVGLAKGGFAGLGAAAILLVGWFALNLGRLDQFPQVFFLGGLITVMLVGTEAAEGAYSYS